MATTRTTKKPRPVAVADTVEPLRFVTPDVDEEPEQITAFFIDDQPYTVPAQVSPSVSLRFLKLARTTGTEIAMGELLEDMLGSEAYDALMNYKHLTQQQLSDLMELMRRHAMGSLEGPKGASRSA